MSNTNVCSLLGQLFAAGQNKLTPFVCSSATTRGILGTSDHTKRPTLQVSDLFWRENLHLLGLVNIIKGNVGRGTPRWERCT